MTDIDFSDLIDELLGEEPSEPEKTQQNSELAPSTLVLIESTIELIDPGSESLEESSSDESISAEMPVEQIVVPRGVVAMDPELAALRNWLDKLPYPMQKALLSRCGQLYAIVLEAQAKVNQ